jgi:hypothetical protein
MELFQGSASWSESTGQGLICETTWRRAEFAGKECVAEFSLRKRNCGLNDSKLSAYFGQQPVSRSLTYEVLLGKYYNELIVDSLRTALCQGDSYSFGGQWISEEGIISTPFLLNQLPIPYRF